MVRVNDMETGFTEKDLEFAIQEGTYAITLPMVKGPEDVLKLELSMLEDLCPLSRFLN